MENPKDPSSWFWLPVEGSDVGQLITLNYKKTRWSLVAIVTGPLTLTWPMCQIWHILFLQILNAPADCMVRQTL